MLAAGAVDSALAQSPYRFEWARAISGPLNGESGQDLVVAADGSVYVVGSHGGLDLDGDGDVDLPAMTCGPCDSGMDPLLVKFDPQGYVVWLRSPDGPRTDWGQRVALDGTGGVYTAGVFRDSLAFESGPRIFSRGQTDGFLARYDGEGQALWAVAIGGAAADGVTGVAVDREGNVYAAATVRGAVDVDGDGSQDVRTTGEVSPLVVSYTAGGALRWVRVVETPTSSFGGQVAVGPEGGLFLGGTYSDGTIDFDGDGRPDLPPAEEGRVPYLARFEADGSFGWARSIGSGAFAATARGLLVTGGGPGAIDLDADGAPDADGGDGTSYLAHLAPDGSLMWVRTLPPRIQMHLATDGERIAVSGLYAGPIDVDGDGVLDGAADPDGKSEGIVAVFDAAGDPLQAFTVVGPGSDQLRAAGFSPDGRILYATGFVRLSADFDADGGAEGAVRCDARGDLILAGYAVGSDIP